MELQFVEKYADWYKVLVYRLYTATKKPTERKGASSTDVKYYRTTETDEPDKVTTTPERIDGMNGIAKVEKTEKEANCQPHRCAGYETKNWRGEGNGN